MNAQFWKILSWVIFFSFLKQMMKMMIFWKIDKAWPNAPVWQSMWIFEKFYGTITFWNEEWGQNGPKNVPKNIKLARMPLGGIGAIWHSWSADRHLGCADWHLGMLIGIPNLALTFHVFLCVFVIIIFFFCSLKNIFYPFWTMNYFPS